MTEKEKIHRFFEGGKIAVAGVTVNPQKFGYGVYQDLKKKGYIVYPINPKYNEINGERMYNSVDSVPDDVPSILIITPAEQAFHVFRAAIGKGFKNIWIQSKIDEAKARELEEKEGFQLILHRCIHMFAEPVEGFHNFHKKLSKFFGAYPK